MTNRGLDANNSLSTSTLKLWAIIAMFCDHFGYLTEAWDAAYYEWPWFLMHAFGRLAAPIFFYLLALGYRRTRDANRYTLRLLAFALISYVPYVWYFYGAPPNVQNFLELNVIFTMLFGLLLLRAIHEVRNPWLKVLLIVLCLVFGYFCDYGLYGLAMILVCDLTRDSRRGTVLGMAAMMMVYVYLRTSGFFPADASPLDYIPILIENPLRLHRTIVYLCQLLSLILIVRHKVWAKWGGAEPKPGFLAKWGCYIFYPAHIAALLVVRLTVF
ncbi:MAG: conjugal transfer protein TraX [Clostridiales bacterium]|nr:conjugal transfer protein TraX [Clostridiales bacterium]